MPALMPSDRQPVERGEAANLVQRRLLPQSGTRRRCEEAVHCRARETGLWGRHESIRIQAPLDGQVERGRTAAQPADGRVVAGAQPRSGLDENRAVAIHPDHFRVRRAIPDLEGVEHAAGVFEERLLALAFIREELDRVVEDARGATGGWTVVAPERSDAVMSGMADRVDDVLRTVDELLHEDGLVPSAKDVRPRGDRRVRAAELGLGLGRRRPNRTRRCGAASPRSASARGHVPMPAPCRAPASGIEWACGGPGTDRLTH